MADSIGEQSTSFERDTLHGMLTGAARYWVINHYLHRLRIPDESVTYFAYPDGFDNHLRGKRVRITLEIEDAES